MNSALIQIQWLALGLLLASLTGSGRTEVIDRVVAIVRNAPITQSEIDRQRRLESFFNLEPLDPAIEKRREALERLISRRLIRLEMDLGGFVAVSDEDVQRQLQSWRAQRYLGGRSFQEALRIYGLTEQDCEEFAREQLNFERYVAFRFKTGVLVPQPEVERYYEEIYVPEHRRIRKSEPPPLEDVDEEIEEVLRNHRADVLVEQHVKELGARARIEILEESLRDRGQ